ncbi:hypothetical protein GOODEAATRI_013798 [Goodea atripinnis]|uniref:Glucosidase II beta subunit N-terminal domain-containing protein n=1 Tax=Goodea atripinnis TaxID=208336 RepID=A0ABV0MTT0_9TELE
MRFHLITAAFLWVAFVESRKIRGISSSYKRFYRERKSFLCIDGSKMIPFDQVNDDYCDCADGSDEPGKHSLITEGSAFRFQNCVIISCRHRRLTLINILFVFLYVQK